MSSSTFRRAHAGLKLELPSMLRLAGPVVVAELGWMAMGLVDIAFVGRLGPAALGGVSIGNSIFIAVAIFGIGMLFGLDYLVAHAHGGGRPDEVNRSLLTGVYMALILSAVLMTFLVLLLPHLGRLGIGEDVLIHARQFLLLITLGMPPLLLFVALRRYLQAVGSVTSIMFGLLSANILNAAVGYALVFGKWGFPALGVAGAGWATCVARFYLLFVAVVAILIREKKMPTGLWSTPPSLERARLTHLMQLGLPVAIQITLEVGVFAAATILAGRLGTLPLAAHQIALSIASVTFMVPLGISSAGAVRVAQALGAGNRSQAARSGWTAIATSAAFMTLSGLILAMFPTTFIAVFTDDPEVIRVGTTLLRVAAIFQLFDGLQVTASGVLRGTGETRLPMLVNLIGHWAIGLPVGIGLAFQLGQGITGLWSGLCLGLIVVGLVLLAVWRRRAAGWGDPQGRPKVSEAQ
ncbi:MAG: MATE family efflux transporter [Candidatus Eisenbacteria bacterium]|nr:MATE family efflux transporter [Candidatus Eisenbacteria bacterium]